MQGDRAFLLLKFFQSKIFDGIVLLLQKISIPNYPAKLFWVNLMPFVNFNVDSYSPCGSRLKNELNLHVSLC